MRLYEEMVDLAQLELNNFFERWSKSISLEDSIKQWLINHIKYGISCAYCGLPGETHDKCRKEI